VSQKCPQSNEAGFHTKDEISEYFQNIQHDGFMNVRSRERGRPVNGVMKCGRPKGWKEAEASLATDNGSGNVG